MSRTAITISYRDPHHAKAVIERTLQENQFQRATVNNEFVWKGKGLMKSGLHVKIEFTPKNTVILYGWVSTGLDPDHDLSGYIAALPKQNTLKMFQQIQTQIAQH